MVRRLAVATVVPLFFLAGPFVLGLGEAAASLTGGMERLSLGRAAFVLTMALVPLIAAILGFLNPRVRNVEAELPDANRKPEPKPEAIRKALAETKDFKGATGTMTMDKDRNANKPIVVVQIKEKKFNYVTQLMSQ